MYVVLSSHTAVFVGKRKITREICWDEHFGVNSFTTKFGSQEDNQA